MALKMKTFMENALNCSLPWLNNNAFDDCKDDDYGNYLSTFNGLSTANERTFLKTINCLKPCQVNEYHLEKKFSSTMTFDVIRSVFPDW